MKHQDIVRFYMDGIVADDHITYHRKILEHALETEMRDSGFAPVLDLDPQFSLEYDPVTSGFKFMLSIYGVAVGEEEAWSVSGVSNGRVLQRSIRKSKYMPSSVKLASK